MKNPKWWIDGVGAYDLISRQAMLEGGDQILPFVRMFYGSPSTCVWEDEMGNSQDIPQGEGGEQGDPLMPLLFALELHRTLRAVRERLGPSEKVFAFLDDVYLIECCRSTEFGGRTAEPRADLCASREDPSVEQRWVPPPVNGHLHQCSSQMKPEAVVWRGDTSLPRCQQGVTILGVPVGQPEFVVSFLERRTFSFVPTHSSCGRSTGSVVAAVDVLVEVCAA